MVLSLMVNFQEDVSVACLNQIHKDTGNFATSILAGIKVFASENLLAGSKFVYYQRPVKKSYCI